MSPFHRAPKRSPPSAEDLTLPRGSDRPPSSLFVAEARSTERPDLSRGGASAVCLHYRTRARTTQSPTRPAVGTPCQDVPKPGDGRELSLTTFADGKPPAKTRTERLRTFDRGRAPVAGHCPCRGSSFPRERGETSRNDARDARDAPPFGLGTPAQGMLQRQWTLDCRSRVGAHLRRHVRPSNRSRGGHDRLDPTPVRPARLLSQEHP